MRKNILILFFLLLLNSCIGSYWFTRDIFHCDLLEIQDESMTICAKIGQGLHFDRPYLRDGSVNFYVLIRDRYQLREINNVGQLRRRAASALLIQNLEFQTIKCAFVRCSSGKNGQNTQNMCAGQEDLLFAVFEQSIFKVPKKSAFAR